MGGARLGGILITSVTFPYIVRKLGVQEYGVWSYVAAICAFLEIISNPGLTTYASREIAARREASFDLVGDILTLRLLAVLLALFTLLGVIFLEPRREIRDLFLLYGSGFLVSGVISVDYLLNSLEMFHTVSGLRLSQQLLYAAGVFLLVRTPKDIFWLPGSILLSTFAMNVVGWFFLASRGVRLKVCFRPANWKGIVVPSFHYGISSLMSNAYHRAGHIVVRWFLGEYALGIYAAAVRLVDLLRNLVLVLLNVLGPHLAWSAKSSVEFRRSAQAAIVAVALSSIPMALGLMATSKFVVSWVMGPQYLSAVPLVRWMSLYIITASGASLLSGTILYSTGRYRAYLLSSATGAVAGVLLYCLLVRWAGLAGAGAAFVTAELVVGVTAYALLRKELHGLWKSRAIGAAVVFGLLMLGAVQIVGKFESSPLIVILSGVLVYTSLCGWFFRGWLTRQLRGVA